MDSNIIRKKIVSGTRKRFRYNMLLSSKEFNTAKALARRQKKSMASIFIDGLNEIAQKSVKACI